MAGFGELVPGKALATLVNLPCESSTAQASICPGLDNTPRHHSRTCDDDLPRLDGYRFSLLAGPLPPFGGGEIAGPC